MAAPPKPWERPGVNRQNDDSSHSTFMSGSPATSLGSSMSGAPAIGGGDAPPIPTRPSQSGYSGYSPGYSSYGGAGSMYGSGMYSSPYSSGMYGGGYGSGMYGGGYSGYGGMGGYNRFGYGQQNEYNSFSRMAEESSRPAFQSIESIVGAFSSVSMMLDSTFQAVYNSFRAVIGVADNFSRMRIQFAQVFSAFAVFRTLRYLYRKLLVLLRLRPPGYAEEAWMEAGDAIVQQAAASQPGGGKSSWPVLMFFAIIMGGPWLIWKFLKSTFANPAEQGWASGSEDHFVAQAVYDFQGQGTDELSFKSGSNIHIAPKELQPRVKGWLLGSVDGKTVGLIPANYVKVLGKRRGTKTSNYPVPNELNVAENNGDSATGQINQTGLSAGVNPTGLSAGVSQTGLSQEVNQTGLSQEVNQTGLSGGSSAETVQNTNVGTSLVQSPSAMNFENQAQRGFSASMPDMDSMFQNELNPLDSVPDITSDRNENS